MPKELPYDKVIAFDFSYTPPDDDDDEDEFEADDEEEEITNYDDLFDLTDTPPVR